MWDEPDRKHFIRFVCTIQGGKKTHPTMTLYEQFKIVKNQLKRNRQKTKRNEKGTRENRKMREERNAVKKNLVKIFFSSLNRTSWSKYMFTLTQHTWNIFSLLFSFHFETFFSVSLAFLALRLLALGHLRNGCVLQACICAFLVFSLSHVWKCFPSRLPNLWHFFCICYNYIFDSLKKSFNMTGHS